MLIYFVSVFMKLNKNNFCVHTIYEYPQRCFKFYAYLFFQPVTIPKTCLISCEIISQMISHLILKQI